MFPFLAAQVTAADDAKAIVRKAIQAIGGESVLRSARAVHYRVEGSFFLPAKPDDKDGVEMALKGEGYAEPPKKYRLEFRFQADQTPTTQTQVLDGDRGWVKEGPARMGASPDELAEMKASCYIDYLTSLLPLLEDKDLQLSAPENAALGQKKAHKIKVTAKNRPDVYLYFDQASGLVIQTSFTRHEEKSNKDVVTEETLSAYQEIDPKAGDEKILRDARIDTSERALIDFVRKRTLDKASRDKIAKLILALGDSSFEVREKAQNDLVAMGSLARRQLEEARTNADLEIVAGAKECLQRIAAGEEDRIVAAASRLLGRLATADAVTALLNYLSNGPAEKTVPQLEAVLRYLAQRDEKVKPRVAAVLDKRKQALKGQLLFLPGFKYAVKGTQWRDGKKVMDWQLKDVEFYTALDESRFEAP
jgi:hypothetical protein